MDPSLSFPNLASSSVPRDLRVVYGNSTHVYSNLRSNENVTVASDIQNLQRSQHPCDNAVSAEPSRDNVEDIQARECGCMSGACGESQAPTINVDFSLFHLNVRGFQNNYGKIDALIRLHHQPHFVAITETHLTRSTESVNLTNYNLVSRLDRRTQQQGGGIAFFARNGYETSIVHIADSPVDERAWHILHSDYGPILICVWYRRPDYGEVDSIRRFEQEFAMHSGQCVAAMCVGDFNVHNVEWLRFSNSTTPEGRELEDVCSSNGLHQHVKQPTLGDYLLDLVLSIF